MKKIDEFKTIPVEKDNYGLKNPEYIEFMRERYELLEKMKKTIKQMELNNARK